MIDGNQRRLLSVLDLAQQYILFGAHLTGLLIKELLGDATRQVYPGTSSPCAPDQGHNRLLKAIENGGYRGVYIGTGTHRGTERVPSTITRLVQRIAKLEASIENESHVKKRALPDWLQSVFELDEVWLRCWRSNYS